MAQRTFQLPFRALRRAWAISPLFAAFFSASLLVAYCYASYRRRFHAAFECAPCRMVHRVHHRRQRCSMSHRRAAPADMEHLRRCRRRWILLGVMRVLMGGNRGEFFTERHIPKPCVRPRARLGGRPVLHAGRARCARLSQRPSSAQFRSRGSSQASATR